MLVQLRKHTQYIITKRFICTNSDNKLHISSFHITDVDSREYRKAVSSNHLAFC